MARPQLSKWSTLRMKLDRLSEVAFIILPEVLCAFALPSLVMDPPSSPLYELPPIFGLFFNPHFQFI